MNKLILLGYVGRDPELKMTPSGMALAKFSLATTETWKAQDGSKASKTEWHQIVAWGKLAERVEKYVKKGQQLLLEGKVEYTEVKGEGDKKSYYTNIKLANFEFCGKNENSGRPDPEPTGREANGDSGSGGNYDDEIPF